MFPLTEDLFCGIYGTLSLTAGSSSNISKILFAAPFEIFIAPAVTETLIIGTKAKRENIITTETISGFNEPAITSE